MTSGLCRQPPVLLSMLHHCYLLQPLKLDSSLRDPTSLASALGLLPAWLQLLPGAASLQSFTST